MHNCNLLTRKGKADLTVFVLDHIRSPIPALACTEVTALKQDKELPSSLIPTGSGYILLLKLSEKPWLIGGEAWRLLGNTVVETLRKRKLRSALIDLSATDDDVQAMAEGMILGDYRFTEFRPKLAKKRPALTLRIPGYASAVAEAVAIAESQNTARHFVDLPAGDLTPSLFIAKAKAAFNQLDVKIRSTQGISALTRSRFPGLVQVGKGSAAEPALLEIHYAGEGKGEKGVKLALVGKGVTFDSGGISLKPGAGMWTMKADMGGAGAVLGAMLMIARLKPATAVSAYIALAENMPSGTAERPGDIYVSRNGTSIHVDNTDAEGRLVLSDVLSYACENGATHMVDAATLTGAACIAMGGSMAAVMGNDDDWCGTIRQAGQQVGEELWHMPLYGEYRQQLDHPHADINNIGGRNGGTITAGIFLSEFVDNKVKWGHCDIAPVAFKDGENWRYYTKGATGFAARTFFALAKELA